MMTEAVVAVTAVQNVMKQFTMFPVRLEFRV